MEQIKKYTDLITLNSDKSENKLIHPYVITMSDEVEIGLEHAVDRSNNPHLMDVCYAQGWAKNKDYTTYEEANNVTTLGSIFAGDTLLESFNELRHFKKITELQTGSFKNCTKLVSIDLENVYKINNNTFEGCSLLYTIGKTDNIYSIGNNAFSKCSALKYVKIDGVYTLSGIAHNTFNECKSLVSAVIKVSGAIGQITFNKCYNLESLHIIGSISNFGNNVFGECTKLNKIVLDDINTNASITASTFGTTGCSLYLPDEKVATIYASWKAIDANLDNKVTIKGLSELQE